MLLRMVEIRDDACIFLLLFDNYIIYYCINCIIALQPQVQLKTSVRH